MQLLLFLIVWAAAMASSNAFSISFFMGGAFVFFNV